MDVGVYIHFPFCVGRCGYCDFYSTVGAVPHGRYADAVLRELGARSTELDGRLTSIYVGGGTPSLWDPAEVGRVVRGVGGALGGLAEVEVTLEVNPGTVDTATLERLAAAGVNRLSVGVQSMDDATLSLLGRRHTVADAVRIAGGARRVGFASLGCDMICGVPGQGVRQHLDGLARLIDLGPDHVSLYTLTLDASSPLHRRGLRPAEADLAAEMLRRGRDLLTRAGLPQYEVSNYARPGHECRHNQGVWAGRPYLGLGAGACSLQWDGPVSLRRANPALERYLDGAPPLLERVEPGTARFETLFLGLRTAEGIDRQAYAARFGRDPVQELGSRLEPLEANRWIGVDERRIRPTLEGIWFADELALRAWGGAKNRDFPR